MDNKEALARHVRSEQEKYLTSLGLPSPAEVSSILAADFTQSQADAIAAEVYQPLRDVILSLKQAQ